MSQTQYYFLPTVRRGWTANLGQDATGTNRAQIKATLHAVARVKDTGQLDATPFEKEQPVQLYGPGDILGFDPRIVVRTDPKPEVGDFEPNYFPAIEFADADFAWRYTAAVAQPISIPAGTSDDGSQTRMLTPWITLVVLVSESRGDDIRPEFKEGPRSERDLPRHIEVDTSALPDLSNAWRWANAHVTEKQNLEKGDLEAILLDKPESAVCRLLCPRRLRPGTRYAAFVVPTFKLGVLAGLGLQFDLAANEGATTLAWYGDANDENLGYFIRDQDRERLKLPYYYRWEFRTGMRGDFEHLVRLLEPRALEGLGIRDIDCKEPGYIKGRITQPEAEPSGQYYLGMEGALQSLDTRFTCWGMDPCIRVDETEDIRNVTIQVLPSSTSVRIAWQTTRDARSYIEYGETTAYGSLAGPTGNRRKHAFTLDGLAQDKTYHFRIVAQFSAREQSATDGGTFQLPQKWLFQQELANLISKPELEDRAFSEFEWNIAETEAVDGIKLSVLPSGDQVYVTWHTSKLCPSQIEYGEEKDTYGQSAGTLTSATDHNLILASLKPGKTYHFKIVARADDGTAVAETQDGTFEMPSLPWVVPPIYGRWHYGRLRYNQNGTAGVVDAQNQEAWIDVLNLDPRHRAAAGLGSEVIRKQQEALMASAWEQLGAIESANDLLRRAQFGRDTSISYYQRISQLPDEDFLRVTQPVQVRVLVDDSDNGRKVTAGHYLRTNSRIPAAALDPALRHIFRARGPIRKRQKAGRSANTLTRLASGDLEAAGPPPKPVGTTRLCDITRRLRDSLGQETNFPTVSLTADPTVVDRGGFAVLEWSVSNVESCVASGDWSGPRPASGSERVGPLFETSVFTLTCLGPGGGARQAVIIEVRSTGSDPGGDSGDDTIPDRGDGPLSGRGEGDLVTSDIPGSIPSDLVSSDVVPPTPDEPPTPPAPSRQPPPFIGDPSLAFCDEHICCDQLLFAIEHLKPFEEIPEVPDPKTMAQIVCDTLEDWLNSQPEGESPEPPVQGPDFVNKVKEMVLSGLDPNQTILERTKQRLRLRGDLLQRFEEGARGDPLDIIMWAPHFPQPMYEPLRDISHELLLPGVETIRQNTIGLLETNRRFMESYLCGLNHEFAGELLWRGYPTDQRGSYFRQFWDVSEYVPRPYELYELLQQWLDGRQITNVPAAEKVRILRRHLDTVSDQLLSRWLAEAEVTTLDELPEVQKHLIKRLQDEQFEALSDIPEEETNELVAELVKQERLQEKLKDITALVTWGDKRLGNNQNRPGENLVLVIRGDLLKRYPNALVYAIDAVPVDCVDGESVPGLPEYLKCYIQDDEGNPVVDDEGNKLVDEAAVSDTLANIRRIFPIFRAMLPPDLTFFGFPFSEEDATGNGTNGGKFFVFEERVSEARFGLDSPADDALQDWESIDWDDLSWSHFGFGADGNNQHYGVYLDAPPKAIPNNDSGRVWEYASSAQRASITLQKPVRIAVHAKQMIPEEIES